jgi:hypothetical protein
MRTTDLFNFNRSSKRLNESLQKTFGTKINFESFDTEKLEDARNKLRTQIHTARTTSGFNETVENETLSKAQFMHDAIVAELMDRQEHIVDNSVEESSSIDMQAVNKIISRFDQNMNEIGGYGDPDYKAAIAALQQGDVETAIGAVVDTYGDQDGGEVRGMDAYIEDLQDEFEYLVQGGNEGVEMERVRDPEDWDEGNTEPANNFAVYINGKKWKVFKGRGRYADDQREQTHYQQLKDWAAKKSADTGKQWSVSITGENPTESIDMDQIRKDAADHLKKSIDKQSDDRIAKLKQGGSDDEPFMAQVGRKIIGGVKGAAKGFMGRESVENEATEKFNPLKHVKNPTQGEKDAAKDVKRGSYSDRAAMLKSAEKDGRLKELSTNTLKSYQDKAGKEIVHTMTSGDYMTTDKSAKKVMNRMKGSEKADNKIWKRNESINTGEDMRNLREGEIQQASAIVTAKTMVDRVGRWIEELSGMENDTLLQLGDSIRDEMGQEQAKAFIEAVAPAIQQALENLKATRDTLSTGVRSLASGEQPTDMLGAEPAAGEMGDEMGGDVAPDAMNDMGAEAPADDFAAAEPAAGGLEGSGREQRESINRQNRLLSVLAG